MQAMPRSLWALLAGNFVIGTGVMVVPGTLNELSDSLSVSPGVAGQLISVSALVVCVGAPLLAALVSDWDRRRLLALTMTWYGALLALCAAMPNFGLLMPVRVLAMLAPAIFTPQAAASAGLLVPAHMRGRAVTFVFLGWSAASVLGLPVSTWLGGHFGWRTAFMAVAVLALASAVWVWRAMPDGVRPAALSRSAWREVFGSRVLMGIVAVTAAMGASQFVMMSYFAPLMKDGMGVDSTSLSLFWAWFGACGLIGNMAVSRNIDRVGAGRIALGLMLLMLVSQLLWPLAGSLWVLCLIMLPWGLACFGVNSAQQARLVARAPALAPGSIALNTSGIYVGQAIGTMIGGVLLSHGLVAWMNWAAATLIVLAIGLSALLERQPR